MRRTLALALVLLGLAAWVAAPVTAMARTFDYLFVAGDSLSVPGNVFAITSSLGALGVDPFPPSPP
jgi:hypothetical protein